MKNKILFVPLLCLSLSCSRQVPHWTKSVAIGRAVSLELTCTRSKTWDTSFDALFFNVLKNGEPVLPHRQSVGVIHDRSREVSFRTIQAHDGDLVGVLGSSRSNTVILIYQHSTDWIWPSDQWQRPPPGANPDFRAYLDDAEGKLSLLQDENPGVTLELGAHGGELL